MALYITEEDVAELADMPMAVSAVESVMAAHALGEAIDLPRQRVRLESSITHVLQGAVEYLNITGFKAYTSTRSGAQFWIHLFDACSGLPLAVLAGDRIGVMRTGAAGAVSAKWLARKHAKSVAVIGAGKQAEGQIRALALTHKIEKFKVFARNQGALLAFCQRLSACVDAKVEPVTCAQAAIENADIVVTMTTASKPVFDARWLSEGAHIIAAGSNSLLRQEISGAVLSRVGLICVDSRETALRESGDLLPAIERGFTRSEQWITLGELISGVREGRRRAEQITLFESQGMAIQDLALAARIFDRAVQQGYGQPLPY